MKKTDILDVVSRKLSPFILLFGCYVITYGHLSPGGGFQGGVVLVSGIILLVLCKGVDTIEPLFPIKSDTVQYYIELSQKNVEHETRQLPLC